MKATRGQTNLYSRVENESSRVPENFVETIVRKLWSPWTIAALILIGTALTALPLK